MLFRLIDKYTLKVLIPYFVFALALLTAILFLQQLSRLSSLYSLSLLSASGIWIFFYAMLPKTLAFTLPMSTLIAALLCISKLRSESEFVVLQSSGISNSRIFKPVIVFALLVSLTCAYLNLYLSPEVLSWLKERVKNVTQEDIASAISIGAFNSGLKDLNIYIKEGNSAKGEWRGIFITKNEGNFQRVISAKTGTLDFDGSRVELVLREVTSLRFSTESARENNSSIVIERLQFLRFEIADNLERKEKKHENENKGNYEEILTSELIKNIKSSDVNTEAVIQFQRRTALSFSPIVLALLGLFAGTYMGRAGKAFGLVISLILLLSYYMVFLTGEQLSRTGLIPLYLGGWLANILFPILLFAASRFVYRSSLKGVFYNFLSVFSSKNKVKSPAASNNNKYDLTKVQSDRRYQPIRNRTLDLGLMGYLDKGIIKKIVFFFLLTYLTFVSLFLIFTFFELWKSIFSNNVSALVVIKYLLYLLPLVTIQILGPCLLVAVFVSFLLMMNRNEIVIWLAGGIGIYRLLTPVLLVSFSLLLLHWWVQERVMPQSNVAQDSLRSLIKTGFPKTFSNEGRQWLAVDNYIFNYEYNSQNSTIKQPIVYLLDDFFIIKKVSIADEGKWSRNDYLVLTEVSEIDAFSNSNLSLTKEVTIEKQIPNTYFNTFLARPFYLTAPELKRYIEIAKVRGEDTKDLSIAYQRRFSDPFSILVFSLFGISTALLFNRSKPFLQILAVIACGISIIVFTQLLTNVGVQIGLPIAFAAWSPYLLFAAVGTYLLAMLKT